jgi:hypothetical protein
MGEQRCLAPEASSIAVAESKVDDEAECLQVEMNAQEMLQTALDRFLESAPRFAKLRTGATKDISGLVRTVAAYLFKKTVGISPLPLKRVESLRDLAKAVDDEETHRAACETLLGVVEKSSVESLQAALEGDFMERANVLTLNTAVDKVRNLKYEKGTITELMVASYPALLEGLACQLKSGQVSSEVVKPWIDVVSHMASDSDVAALLQTPPATLKTSVANLLTLVKAIVHVREVVREFSSFNQNNDTESTQRVVLVLQAAVVKLSSYAETGSHGKVEETHAATVSTSLQQLAKTILEGGGTLVGLNTILSEVGKKIILRLYEALESKLVELEKINGCHPDKPGGRWCDGVDKTATWAVVCLAAKDTLLAVSKAVLTELQKLQGEATQALTR